MPRSTWKPTDEQEAIRAAAGRPSGSVMVEAGAGCAKSSTLELAAQEIRSPALALAFNKRIASDLAAKVPQNFTVKTMNGLGHMAWSRALPGISLRLEDRKIGKLVSQVAKDRRVDLTTDQWDGLRQLVGRAQHEGLVPANDPAAAASLIPDNESGWQICADAVGLVDSDRQLLWELAREVLAKSNEQARQGIISFDDQIYASVMLGGRFPQFPVTFVDEDQDLSPLNIRMLEMATRPDGRLFAVGDKRQAIYAWRGAVGDSAERIRGLRATGDWSDYPLMTTFRCPKSVVERQQGHVPLFRAFEANPAGQVVQLPTQKGSEPGFTGGSEYSWTWTELAELVPTPGTSLAILCRNNAPLLSLAFKLLRRQIGCHMLGRDIGRGLISLARKISPDDATLADKVAGLVLEWRDHEASLARANQASDAKIDSIYDRTECLQAVLTSTDCRDAGQLRSMLEKLFARTEGLVTLSSIHRAKGLEWDCVLHLDPWRPQSSAKRAAKRGDLVQVEQERNLVYVAETRTRHTLVLANLEDFQ